MPILRAQFVIPHVSAIPDHAVSYTMHFDDSGDFQDYAGINTALYAFFTAPAVGTSIHDFLSPVLDTENCELRIYDLSDPEPRVPKAILANNLGPTVGTPAPSEVAVRLTAQGPRVSGIPQASRRGGFFLGPFNDLIIEVVDDVARVNSSFITAASNAAVALISDSGVWPWCIWSPTLNQRTIIDRGWIDNAFDTQRRRGEIATVRTLWGDS